MSIEPGDILYRYNVRHDRLIRYTGTVTNLNGRRVVIFKDSVSTVRCPREQDIGIIRSDGGFGPTLWMDSRDDELAREIFLEYEEDRLSKLRKQIAEKEKIVSMLKRDNVRRAACEDTKR